MIAESLHGEVREVDPKTGEYIELRPVAKKLVVNHYLLNRRNPAENVRTIKEKILTKGLNSLTEREIEITYKRIKKLCEASVTKMSLN